MASNAHSYVLCLPVEFHMIKKIYLLHFFTQKSNSSVENVSSVGISGGSELLYWGKRVTCFWQRVTYRGR